MLLFHHQNPPLQNLMSETSFITLCLRCNGKEEATACSCTLYMQAGHTWMKAGWLIMNLQKEANCWQLDFNVGAHITSQLDHYNSATEGQLDLTHALLTVKWTAHTHNLTILQHMPSNHHWIYQVTPCSHNLHFKSSSHHLGLVKNYHYI
jgi:hypothetical protein